MSTFALPLKNGRQIRLRVHLKDLRKIKIEKFCRKIWRLKNNAYLCSPVRKTGHKKFIEKTEYCTRSKYREKQFIEKR